MPRTGLHGVIDWLRQRALADVPCGELLERFRATRCLRKKEQTRRTVAIPRTNGRPMTAALSSHNGGSWPKEFNDALEASVKEGKIGLVIVHAANNAFGGWNEYNEMIGMGWRNKDGGDRLYLDDAGKQVKVKNNEGDASGHRYSGKFSVTVRNSDHPITKGMPREWLHNNRWSHWRSDDG